MCRHEISFFFSQAFCINKIKTAPKSVGGWHLSVVTNAPRKYSKKLRKTLSKGVSPSAHIYNVKCFKRLIVKKTSFKTKLNLKLQII